MFGYTAVIGNSVIDDHTVNTVDFSNFVGDDFCIDRAAVGTLVDEGGAGLEGKERVVDIGAVLIEVSRVER
jgi:hypothetical protein